MRALFGQVLIVVGFGSLFPLVAQAASFDCKQAKTPQEKAICATPKLSADDEQMAAAYKAQLAAVPASAQGVLRDDQRQFLRSLATGCAADKPQPLEKLAKCMQPQLEDRIKLLKEPLARKGGVAFLTRTVTLLGKDTGDRNFPQEEEANPGYGTLTVSWPFALAPGPQWAAWNNAVRQVTQQMANPDGKPGPNGVWQDSWAADQDASISASVDYADEKMVSTSLGDDFMGHGAAHPGELYEVFHWLLREQRELKAGDVFSPASNWKSFVIAKCRADLAEQGRANGGTMTYDTGAQLTKTLGEVIQSTRNWTMDAKGLTIGYPEYSVAPRVAHPDATEISWASLRPYLVAGFTPPR